MLVATMTATEIYGEIMRDFSSLWNRAHTSGKLFQQEMKRRGLQNEIRSLTYKTAHRNEWTILFNMHSKWIKTAFYLKSYDKVGVVAYLIQFINWGSENKYNHVVKHNSHFFKRYNERMELGLTDPAKVIKHFFRNNFESEIGQTELLDDGTRYIHFIYNEGIGIGWQDDEKKTIQMKTFISNKTLSEKLRSLAEHIKYGDDSEEFNIVIRPENMRNKI